MITLQINLFLKHREHSKNDPAYLCLLGLSKGKEAIMNYMYGEKAAKEMRDREIRIETRAWVTAYLDGLDEDDAVSARTELVEMFGVKRPVFSPPRPPLNNPLQQMQQQAAGYGGLFDMIGIGRPFG